MKIGSHVTYAIDDVQAGKWDAALMHACVALDGTARKLDPKNTHNRERYVKCIRSYYWLIEPFLAGINLEETRFENIPLKSTKSPDLAEIIYEKFRCYDAHGEEIPQEFSLLFSHGNTATWALANGLLRMPDRIIWALLGVSVFSKVNSTEESTGSYFLSLRHPSTDFETKFLISECWGKENEIRSIASEHNQLRVKLNNLTFLEV